MPQVAEIHNELLRRAAATANRSIWAGSHSPGVVRFLEDSLDRALPDPAYRKASNPIDYPVIGRIYTWKEVQGWGDEETFLAKRDGRIVCATLDGELNPDAPGVMIVGKKEKNIQRAKEFCEQKGPIPLFIKEETNQWRYHGHYEVAKFTTSRRVMARFEKTRGAALTRVIFLRSTDGQDDLSVFPDIDYHAFSAPEARKLWVQHFRRERNRKLVATKKQKVLLETGKIVCEACAFNFTEFYKPHAESFCEVHHRKPLKQMDEGTLTKLEDLAVPCSNCHRVIHLINPMPSVEKFRLFLKSGR